MTAFKQQNGARTPSALQNVWEQRTQLVKQELAAASAANDAKTMRLKALRLERERQQAEAEPPADRPSGKPHPQRVKRIVVT